MNGPALAPAWFVDAHVHFHACFPLSEFFEGARRNVARLGRTEFGGQVKLGCLLLTDRAGENHFLRLRDSVGRSPSPVAPSPIAGRTSPFPTGEEPASQRPEIPWGALPPGWSSQATAEAESVRFHPPAGPPLALVQGRQVATREGLEILTLCSSVEIPDGLSLPEAAHRAVDAGALTVIPWGFGKWWLGRGQIVAHLLESDLGDKVYLGDNGNRWAGAGDPALFRRGRAVLPGSDPLPFPHHASRAGSYGFQITGDLDPERPAASLRQVVAALRASPVPLGKLRGATAFLGDQLRMQLRMQLRKGAPA